MSVRSPLLLIIVFSLATPAPAQDPAGDALSGELAAAAWNRRYDAALLERAAKSKSALDRRDAARAAGLVRDKRAVPLLLTMTRDVAGPVRRAAFFALGQIADDSATIALRDRLRDAEAMDRPAALEALGKIRDPRAVSAVAAMLGHDGPHTRGGAALALFRLGDASALPDVLAALAREQDPEPRWKMVYAAWRLLAKRAGPDKKPVAINDVARKALAASLAAGRPRAERVFAARAFASITGGRAVLLELLNDDDRDLVVAAVRGLARNWDFGTADKLLPLVKRKDAVLSDEILNHWAACPAEPKSRREQAAGLLEQAADADVFDARLRIKALATAASFGKKIFVPRAAWSGTDEEYEEIEWSIHTHEPATIPTALPKTLKGRVAAAEACGDKRIPKARAVPVLIHLLKVRDFVVRSLAISGLAKRGGPEHLAAVLAAAREVPGTGWMDVRIEAANALAAWKRYDPWLDDAARDDPDAAVRLAAREALQKLERKVPSRSRTSTLRLHGHGAAGIRRAARALRGARVRLETTRGVIEMVLLPDEAPAHCVNMAALCRDGFYDGLSWHRVVGNFVIQGGCPRGDGWGGPGYVLPDEIGTRPYVRGTVGMPKSGDDTGGCQIFITHLPTPHLDGRYTVYAQVVSGLEVIDRIRVGDKIKKATLLVAGS
ncbi:MAG: peptidylprolyl isomerase [Planctomycetota bacterium]|nr:peptidylprolyl isomerase [Planctomycetota bacterium]